MKLQTQIQLQSQNNNLIDYNANVLLIGSCFVENIGDKLDYFKFQNAINPFGILFHPIAIENCIHHCIDKKVFSEDDIFFQNEQWHCFDVHSRLSDSSKEDLLLNLNKQVKSMTQQLNNSTHVIITLGTAWIYKLVESNTIVANCHKLPQNQFKKELLSVESITNSLERIIKKIHLVNSKTTIIFTVSPVRHLKDGFIENTLSKSHLITAIHQVVNQRDMSFYFPSYEIMMDELRDYRFYKEDMLHPNTTAVNYIWEKFQQVWISSSSEQTMNEVDVIRKGLLHKPFNPESKAHLEFLNHLKAKQKALHSRFLHITF